MDIDVNRIRALLSKREEIDAELVSIVTGIKERKPQKCSRCGSEEHNSRSCPEKTE